ncbi:hypothetical protein VB716_08475 [Synechococcus sp. CCY9201]|uniref:hypothetical protein n=1 Tax=Synechococcus sp. CCY9201 TaxID=174697 RepID=UPI002B21BDF5|nr:hypothetical protein [Synechococcus sp. CCY9201]MEA5474255.1 hypothetical protein [Synechococcus sp. CCY9201]
MNPANPWDQQPDEPSRAYELFAVYLEAGPSRSIAEMARITGHSDSNLRRYATRFNWKHRAEAHDRELLGRVVTQSTEEREAEHRAQIRAFADQLTCRAARLGDVADRLIALATRSVQTMLDRGEDLDARLLPSVVNAAAALTTLTSDLQSRALGIDELMELLEEDVEQG